MGRGVDVLYGVGLAAASPWIALGLLRTGKWRTDWKGRLGHAASAGLPLESADADRPRILIHAVSVGEVNLIAPLLDRLADEVPAPQLIVATTTNTGFARASARYAELASVVRYPLDFSGAVGRFLDAVRPDLAVSVELEVWPNFTQACQARGIPMAVVNGRLSPRSFRGYRRFNKVLRPMFGRLSAVGAQDEAYAERFRAMGAPVDWVTVLGNLKWDAVRLDDPDLPGKAQALAQELGLDRDRPTVVAGSTGPGEEAQLLSGLPDGLQLVLAPRKPERFEEVAQAAAPWGPARLSRCRADARPSTPTRVFVVDTIGDLASAYALADVALVGRSWNGMYGSNPVEPLAAGAAPVIGPDHADFATDVQTLQSAGGIEVAPDPWPAADALLADRDRREAMVDAGRREIQQRQGAANRYADLLMSLLPSNELA
ncbi:MAG: glycosyltransferase N-terminal domain-containing protein [Planctomycetota bacterium]